VPASSFSKKVKTDDNLLEGSSSKPVSEDLQELRQQLQSMKKQTLAMMEQARKASEQEELALRQAKEAMAAKDAAVLEAEGAATRENSMLELMLEASTDMLGMYLQPYGTFSLFFCAAFQISCFAA
jgi:F0F1-type ATP synthase membrane subunit b/b'